MPNPRPLLSIAPSEKKIALFDDLPRDAKIVQVQHRYLNIAKDSQPAFLAHVKRWARRLLMARDRAGNLATGTGGCSACGLCSRRRHVVLYRGTLPCDVLFIGEAPGETEDSQGVPFVGDAGRELKEIWADAYNSADLRHKWLPTYGITNIVACIPRTPDDCGTGEIRAPLKEEAEACSPRLLEILALANPRAIVLLGDIAKRFFPKEVGGIPLKRWNGKLICLAHPARILHLLNESPTQASLLKKKMTMALTAVLKELDADA